MNDPHPAPSLRAGTGARCKQTCHLSRPLIYRLLRQLSPLLQRPNNNNINISFLPDKKLPITL
jgi:hypothetical protein